MTPQFSTNLLPGLEGANIPESQWHFYAVVDPCLVPTHDSFSERLIHRSLRPRRIEIPAAKCPYVVDTSDLSSIERQHFAENFAQRAFAESSSTLTTGSGRSRQSCFMMLTPLKAEELVARMEQAAVVLDLTGSPRLLRYWDPRVIEHLVSTTAPLSWGDVFPFITAHWWFCGWNGEMRHFHRSVEHVGKGLQRQLRLNEVQQSWLQEVGELNAIFERVRTKIGVGVGVGVGVWQSLKNCLKAAQQARLSASDRVVFASHRFVLGVPIEKSIRMQQMLDDVHQHGLSFAAIQADLDDQDWREIALQAALDSAPKGYTLP